jgi:tetratricopeptide (TPR) repeat protein
MSAKMAHQSWSGLVLIEPTIGIFLSYDDKDELLLRDLELYLGALQRCHSFEVWHGGKIMPGTVVRQWNHEHLNKAQIILLMISQHFMNSDDCYLHQMQLAMERYERGEALVIPVILRPVHWQGAPFAKLQVLPTGAKPVTSSEWHALDEALFDVAEGILKALEMLTARTRWLNESMIEYEAKQYAEALATLDRAIHLDPSYADSYLRKGRMLLDLERFQEAFDVYNQATKVIPNNTWVWHGKGLVLFKLGQSEKAIVALYRSFGINTSNIGNWHRKGRTLSDGLCFAEVLTALDQAMHLDPSSADTYLLKGKMLLDLERFQEAFDVYDQATKVIPNNTWIWHDKGLALFKLGYDEEAIVAFNRAIEIDPNNMWAWHHKATTLERLAQQAHEMAQQLGYKE